MSLVLAILLLLTPAISSSPDGAVRGLVQKLSDADSGRRAGAAKELAAIGSAEAVRPLLAVLGEENAYVRDSCYTALLKLTDPAGIDVLVEEGLAHASPFVRASVAEWAGETRKSDAVQGLIQALDDRSGEVRLAAASALGEIRDPVAEEPLEAALRVKDPLRRAMVLLAYVAVARERGGKAVEEALEHRSWEVRVAG